MKTKWLRLSLAIGLLVALGGYVSASPSMPGLPFTMDENTGVITWNSAVAAFYGGPPAVQGTVDYYSWALQMNGAPTLLTQRLNTSVPPNVATVDGSGLWTDDLDNGTAGTVSPLGPGNYDLHIVAYDTQDLPTPNSPVQSQHFAVHPLTPVVNATEEVWTADGNGGTFNITWSVQTSVEEAWVEWDVNGTTYNSGWIANDGSFNTSEAGPDIDPLYFWDATMIRVKVRDTQSMLESLAFGTYTLDPVPWAPATVTLDASLPPNWVINYSYPAAVDPDYFVWKLYSTFNGSNVNITQGIEDTDKNYAVGFNPVTDSTLQNIYVHDWVMSIGSWAVDGAEAGVQANAAPLSIVLGTVGITGNVTADPDANPWVFTVTYSDAYNDAAWGVKGPTGYLDRVELTFRYDITGASELETPAITPIGTGVMELTVYPGTELTNPAFVNKYNDWRVEAQGVLDCQVPEVHKTGVGTLDFETVCPPFLAPLPGATYYFYPPGTQVPDYVEGPYPSGGPVPNTYEQGVSSGLFLTTQWQFANTPPDATPPAEFYGNTTYLRSHVEYQNSSVFAGPYAYFAQANVAWNGTTHTRQFFTAPNSVTFYLALVNMQYDNFGDVLGTGSGTWTDVSPDAEIDKWEVDDLNPDPAVNKTLVEEPVTEAYGNPWTFTFDAPATPDFDEWQAFLRALDGPPNTITTSAWTDSFPNEHVTWTVDQATFEADITPYLPFGDPFGTYRFGVRTSDNTVPFDNDFQDSNNSDPLVFEYTLYDALGKITDLDGVAGQVSIEMLTAERLRAGWRAVDHKPFGVFLTNIHYKAQLQYNDPALGWIAVDETDFIYPYTPAPAEHLLNPVMYAEFCAGDYDYPEGDYRVKVYYGYEMPVGGWLYDDAGSAMSEDFEITFEGYAMAAPTPVHTTGILTSFTWVSPDLDLANEPHVMEYQVEIFGANGLEHDETVSGDVTSLTFDPASWWPAGNVYSTYQARVRAVDSEERTGDWSPLSTIGNFPLPLIAEYPFEVRHSDGTGAILSEVTNERELVVVFPRFVTAPTGFINWDMNKVTFDFQVDSYGSPWYYDLIQNQYANEAHVVPVGVEGYYKSYEFYLRPLYDGVPMMAPGVWQVMQPYFVDLEAPPTPTGLAVTVNDVTVGPPPVFDWDFNWADVTGAANYTLTINRLTAQNGGVDATLVVEGLTASELLNFNPSAKFADRVYGYYNCTVVALDGLGNTSLAAVATFQQDAPSLNVSTVTLSLTQIGWVTDPERVSYDVRLAGDNGLEYEWENLTASPLAINLATLFPGQNVYTTWHAYVRAYDRDGNVGDWYASAALPVTLPSFAALSFDVYRGTGAVAPVGTAMVDRELFVKWAEYTSAPAGFLNWDKTKVTFQLRGTMSGDETHSIDVFNINNGETNIQVHVGEEGKEINYSFAVDMFYDGVKVVQTSPLTKQYYIIDLKAPAPAALNAAVVDRAGAPASYQVDFSWSAPATATKYDLVVNRLSNVSGAVDATFVAKDLTTNSLANFELVTHFGDRVFGDYQFFVVAYDAQFNSSTSAPGTFSVPAPAKVIASVSLTTTAINWSAAVEAVSYDVWLKSDTGLQFIWEKTTGTSKVIDLAVLFPGQNVYTRWTAYVRAYDRDGNVGQFYTNTATFGLPNFTALGFEVYKADGTVAPVSPTKMNLRDLFVKWAEYNTIPTGFINWDKTKVTFQLKAQLSIDSAQSIDVVEINNGETNVQVPVGEVGKEIGYSFTVDMFYDGVKVTQNSPLTKQTYVIDLKAPPVPVSLVYNTTVSPWTFGWTTGGGDTTGYIFELQKRDPATGLVINDYTLDLTATSTTVNPLQLNWSVFGDYWWRVQAYDQFRNTSASAWVHFTYTLSSLVAPTWLDYELIGEEPILEMFEEDYSTRRKATFYWNTPATAIIGIDMEDVDYVFELLRWTGSTWANVTADPLTWSPTLMMKDAEVGITGVTAHYKGRVRVEYRGEHTAWVYSDMFAIDLERPGFDEDVTAPNYSSTTEEYPSWLFTWGDAYDQEVGLGGFLFVLERLEGGTTHAVAILDLPVEYEEEPEEEQVGGFEFSYVEGMYMLEMDPFEFVETIDGIYRYTVVPYDRLDNLGWPIAGEFTSVWTDGGSEGTYPVINLYGNWMGEIQELGDVNNNTYATVSFDIYGMEGYTLEFKLNGTLLVEGTDYRLIELPEDGYPGDLHYLVLLESVRDMIQADSEGELTIEAYIEESGIRVQFTIDAFGYDYLNQRTGFGFGRFRPALND